MNILKTIGVIILTVSLLDLLGFTFWVLSEQLPVDSFYIGSITSHILSYITR